MNLKTVLILVSLSHTTGFLPIRPSLERHSPSLSAHLGGSPNQFENILRSVDKACKSACMVGLLSLSINLATPIVPVANAADSLRIVQCLFSKCQIPLAKCVGNPKCLANVICINTCNNRPDETECQIECGNLWENDVVGEFNKCAVSEMSCVPQKLDDGKYPIPPPEALVPKFDTSIFQGRWYISAGQNELFDRFPCQVHFFTQSKPGTFFGKLNWRIEEPDGEFFTRDALQRFVQDPQQPAHLLNHDNEYLHYQDDWYIVDYEPDNNAGGLPPFVFVYYRGSNDAWDGYGGAVIYTRAAALDPTDTNPLLPRLRLAASKVGMDWDKDFAITDNSCRAPLGESERLLLREKFAGKVLLQTEEQIRAAATRVRGNALNSVKAQQLFVQEEIGQAESAYKELSEKTVEFEQEVNNQGEETAATQASVSVPETGITEGNEKLE